MPAGREADIYFILFELLPFNFLAAGGGRRGGNGFPRLSTLSVGAFEMHTKDQSAAGDFFALPPLHLCICIHAGVG